MTQIMFSFVGQACKFNIVLYSHNTLTGKVQQHGKTEVELGSKGGVITKEIDILNDEMNEGVYKFFVGLVSTQNINGVLNASLKFKMHTDFSSRLRRHFGNAAKDKQRMYAMTAIQESFEK